jgi:serine/threonine-protein kinase
VIEMTPERWAKLSPLLDRALTIEASERDAWLEREILDPELRGEVAQLVAGAERTSGVLERAPMTYLAADPHEEEAFDSSRTDSAGTRIGPYRLLGEVGRGGMGVVFQAERADGHFENRVALKLMRLGFDGLEIERRFKRERRILARLEHPAIARILDGGVSGEGRPYFAMELIDGEPLTTFCDRNTLPVEGRLRLFVRVCDAVQYAHGRLVVHRDLKPSNILVSADGDLKLVDFGIAKVLSDDDDPLERTAPGALRLFTPAYAAPEQLTGDPVTVGTDVYALGLILYELLSGRRPFGRATGRQLESAILEVEPPAPSRVLTRRPIEGAGAAEVFARCAATRGTSVRGLARRLAGDLDAIVLMALRKEPALRYASPLALRNDIQRHLEHRPIQARREGAVVRAGKFVRRHRLGFAAATALALSITAGVTGTLSQARQKALQAERARRVTDFVVGLFEAADPAQARGREITARELVEQGAVRLERELGGQLEIQAEMGLVLGRINDRLGLSEAALLLLDQSLRRSSAGQGSASRQTRADALRAKGAALVHLGRAAEAEPLLREAEAAHRALGTRDLDRTLDIAEDLDERSIALRALGRLEDSEAVVLAAFELRRASLGPDHPRIAVSYNNLAVIQRELGKLDEAEANYKRALDLRIPALGREHPETADSLNNLAALLHYRGRYAEAATAFEDVSAVYGRLYGEEHPRTVTAANNLAVVLLKLGDLERAEELFESVLTYWRETASDQHPSALMTRGNLGLLYQMRGQARLAESTAASVVEGTTAALGAEHPVTAIFTLRLASANRELGHCQRAKVRAVAALATLEAIYGPDHQHVAAGLEVVGRIESELGDLEPAEEHLRRAVAIRVARGSAEAFETLGAYTSLAEALRAKGALDEATRLLTENLAVGRRVLPEDHPLLFDLLLGLGTTLAASDRAGDAVPLLAEAVELGTRRFGRDNWRTAMAELSTLELEAANGDVSRNAHLAGRIASTLRAQLGRDHPLVRAARRLSAVSQSASPSDP